MPGASVIDAKIEIPRPDIPDGPAVYDAIMSQIDEDLTTEGTKHLNEKYKDETPEQTKERAVRYDRAKETYDRTYAAWKVQKQGEVNSTVKSAYQQAENVNRSGEEATMQALESQMQSASPATLAA